MIGFNKQQFYLETKNTSYIIKILPNGMLQHVYYGAKVSQDDFSYHNLFCRRCFSIETIMDENVVSNETIPQEYSCFGRGDYRKAALEVCNITGRCLTEIVYVKHEILKDKPRIPDMPHLDVNIAEVETLAVTLHDKISHFDVILYYSVFVEEDIISRYVEIRNTSNQPLQIRNAASLSVDFEKADFDLLTLQGAWGRERHVNRRSLAQGTSSIESRRGSSSHHLNPFAALLSKNADETSGEVFGFTLIYSADFKILAEVDHFENTRVQVGINPETFSWKLKEGESFFTPEALMTYTNQGLNGMSHNFHAVCRNHLGKCADKNIVHPIVINSWEAMYFDMSEQKIEKFISECKGLGIDTFVLDDGWFGHRNDDTTSLGDWYVNKNKFPAGLTKVIECCHKNGLNFGIWFEPEMISCESDLYKAHPDWCIHYEDIYPIESRNQLVLDMARNDVVDNIYNQIAKMIQEYDIAYIKWDFNRNIMDNGSASLSKECQNEHAHRYILGVYSLMQRLTESFPHVFFEGCSAGGGRYDFGILYYMPQIWTSDDSDAIERLKIQYGTSIVYPPSTMVAHVSACPNHQTGRVVPFETRGEVAQMCNYGYELDVSLLSETERNMICAQIDVHKSLEPLIYEGQYYRLRSPFEGNICSWQLVSEDKRNSYVFVGFQKTLANPKGEYLKLQGLNNDGKYYIKQLDVTLTGNVLMNAGIPVLMREKDYDTMVFNLEQQP